MLSKLLLFQLPSDQFFLHYITNLSENNHEENVTRSILQVYNSVNSQVQKCGDSQKPNCLFNLQKWQSQDYIIIAQIGR